MATDTMLRIAVEKGPLAGTELKLPAGKTVTIGRRETADVVLNGDDFVSLEHAEIVFSPTGALLKNRSANGTLVNGRPTTETLLQVGDKVSIGLLHLLTIRGIPAPPARDGDRQTTTAAPLKAEPVPSAASVPAAKKGKKFNVPIWLIAYLSLMVTAGIGFTAMKARSGAAAGLRQVRVQEQQYATEKGWPTEETTHVLRLLDTAVVQERRGDPRSAYEAYREAISVRRPIDPRSPAYRFAASRMAVLGPREPRRR